MPLPSQFSPLLEGDTIHHPDRIRWTEESYIDLPRGKEAAPSQAISLFYGGRRLSFFVFCMTVVFILFFGRLFIVQAVAGQSYAARAERNRLRIVFERATRGLILDRNKRVIVANKPDFVVTITPASLPKEPTARTQVLDRVATVLHEPFLSVIESVSALPRDALIQRQALPFREHVSYREALLFMEEEERLPGFRVEARAERIYPETYADARGQGAAMPLSLAHVVGYLAKLSPDELSVRQKQGYLASDLVGRDGIERWYEGDLRGVHGKQYVETDALGRARSLIRREAPKEGQPIVLAIDLDLQRALEEALVNQMRILGKRERKGAAGVAIDPRNGAIRALVSLPTFPLTAFSGKTSRETITRLFSDEDRSLFNRAIAGAYPSGSTIKPLIALAALAENVIVPQTTILSVGGIAVGPWFFPDWKEGGHGSVDVRRAIAESVNTFFYTIGGGYGNREGLGIDRIERWMRKLYFGNLLGIDLPNEATGLVPTPLWKQETRGERWYIGDTYHLAIGQGDILVTPLQIAAMTSVFANGGTLWRPTLRAAQDPYALADTIAAPEYIRVVREGMRRTVTSGSARFLSTLPVTVAGKTGTAEWSTKRASHAWFTGFAPYDNPELVVTILVEEGGEGSSTAVPVAYEVFREYFRKKL